MPVAKPQTDIEFTNILLNIGTTPCIVDFFATWCGPCNAIAPLFEELSNKYLNVKFVKVDVDKCIETKNKYSISAMPTFIVLLNGQRVDMMKGADRTALEGLAHKWSANCPTQMTSPIPGQYELSSFIDKSQSECLNEHDAHPLRNLLEGVGPLFSDCDEQLIINLPFTQSMRIHSLAIRGPPGKAPKTVKVFANIPVTLGFDNAQAAEPIQTVDFGQEQLVGLKFVKFQNVQNLQLFVENNVGGGDQTVIEELHLYGTPVAQATNMQEFRRVAGKAGEVGH